MRGSFGCRVTRSSQRASRFPLGRLPSVSPRSSDRSYLDFFHHDAQEAGDERTGIGITVAALLIMPLLAWLKRRTARSMNNRALAADAVESAICAYMAGIALAGLAINAAFHLAWTDLVAALAIQPLLIIEGRRALRGNHCGAC